MGIFDDLMNFNGIEFQKEPEKTEKKKKLKPSEQLLKMIENEGFDMSQMEEILKVKGNQLIVSCAGSGKTTTLIFKLLYSFKTGYATRLMEVNGNTIRVPEKVWVCTFLKTGASELESAQRKWQYKFHCADTTSAVSFSTLHAEFLRALQAMGKQIKIVSAKDNSDYLKEVVKSYQLTNANNKPLNSDDYRNLESALAYTRNVLSPKRYQADIYDDLNIGPTIIDAILHDWKAKRVKNGYHDFEDLQEVLYHECYERNNQEVINFLSERYSFIYIDEFQDTSEIQYKLLKVYAINCKQVVALGDDDQTIYSWRGSDINIILNDFKEDFVPTVSRLSVNYRCPNNILNAVKPSIKNNSLRFEKDLKSYKDGGKVRYYPAPNYMSMVQVLSDLVYQDVVEGRSVAILCRKNSDGLLPALLLDKLNKFNYSISGEGMTLNSYIGRTVFSIIKLFTEKSSTSVKNALNLLCWDSYGINNLMKVCKNNKLSIWTIDEKDLSYSCPEIAEKVLTWRQWKKSMGDIKALKLILQDYRVAVFNKDNQFNILMRSVLMAVESLLDYFDYDYVEDFLFELEDINERLTARRGKDKTTVRIATVHEFKGKEADSVYIWNDSQDVYPIKEAEESETGIEEERRIHYIACTRAKQLSTMLYLKNKQGCFVNEMDLSEAEEVNPLKDTSGIVGKLKENLEEEASLKRFEKLAEDKSDKTNNKGSETGYHMSDEEFFGGLTLPVNNSDLYENNEFWGVE